MLTQSVAPIFNIQHFSVHDGPGIRSAVFFKGCNLRCYWCHNPESHNAGREMRFYEAKCIGCGACVQVCPNARDGKTARFTQSCLQCGLCAQECFSGALEMCGEKMTTDAVFADIARDADVYRTSGGGVTLTGGEPLLYPQFARELLERCRAAGIHTGVETAANVPRETFLRVLERVDLLMTDIKIMDEAAHIAATGVSNRQILDNIRLAADSDVPMVIRTPVVPHFNDSEFAISAIADFLRALPKHDTLRWELLPFRGLCASKYASLGRRFEAADMAPPTDERMRFFQNVANNAGIACRAVL